MRPVDKLVMSETGTIRINPAGNEGGEWGPLALEPGATIEGRRVEDLAPVVNDPASTSPLLGYEDILGAFILSRDQYTLAHHENLLAKALVFGFANIEDALPSSLSGRNFLDRSDISAGAMCQLKKSGYPDSDPAFRLFLGNRAQANWAQVRAGEQHFLMAYIFRNGANFEKFVKEHAYDSDLGNEAISFLVTDLTEAALTDVDPDRVGRLNRFFTGKGCPAPASLRTCVTLADQLGPAVFSDARCPNFSAGLTCYIQVLGGMMSSAANMLNLSSYRQANKNNTFTSSRRAVHLRDTLGKLKELVPEVVAHPPGRILIVGPGLEIVDPALGNKAPMRTYEPFVVVEGSVQHLGSSLNNLDVDIIDISPDVVVHLKKVRSSAQDAGAKTFHTWEADITADKIAPAGSYDLVVMLNVFMYLNPAEKVVALDSLRRMLKPGGILLTDLGIAYDRGIEPASGCPATGEEGFTKVPLTAPGGPMPITAFVKRG